MLYLAFATQLLDLMVPRLVIRSLMLLSWVQLRQLELELVVWASAWERVMVQLEAELQVRKTGLEVEVLEELEIAVVVQVEAVVVEQEELLQA